MLHFYIISAIFGEKNLLVIYINTDFTCSAAVCRVSRQIEFSKNLAQMHLKTPITVYMCFRHQDTFKNVFFCPVSLVWCCGDLICSQIQLPARASSQPVLWQGSCLQAFPALLLLLLLLQVSAHAGLCTLPSLPLLSQHPLGSWQSQGFPQQHKDSADNVCRLEWGHEKPVPMLLY